MTHNLYDTHRQALIAIESIKHSSTVTSLCFLNVLHSICICTLELIRLIVTRVLLLPYLMAHSFLFHLLYTNTVLGEKQCPPGDSLLSRKKPYDWAELSSIRISPSLFHLEAAFSFYNPPFSLLLEQFHHRFTLLFPHRFHFTMSVNLSWHEDDDMLDLQEHESIEEEEFIGNQSSPSLVSLPHTVESVATSPSTQESKHQRITAPEDEPVEIELKTILNIPADSKCEFQ